MRGEWAARTTDTSKRSVFGNYRADEAPSTASACSDANTQRAEPVLGAPLQSAIDLAMARSFIHRLLAKAYEDPMPEAWRWLTQAQTIYSLRAASVFAGQSLLPSAETLMVARVVDGRSLPPQKVFGGVTGAWEGNRSGFAVFDGGRRVLASVLVPVTAPQVITIGKDWLAGLKAQ